MPGCAIARVPAFFLVVYLAPLIHVNYYTYNIIISYCLTTVWHDYLLSLINLDHYEKL